MKRIGLFLLAVVMVAGLAGCNNDGYSMSDLVGTWQIDNDKNCTGRISSRGTARVFENGVVISNEGYRGTWSITGDTFTMTFNVFITVTWTGRIENATTMSGTFDGNGVNTTNHGCWTATKTSNSP